jgi:hypothetical protein
MKVHTVSHNDNLVNAIQGNSHHLLWESQKTWGKCRNLLKLNLAIHILTTKFKPKLCSKFNSNIDRVY